MSENNEEFLELIEKLNEGINSVEFGSDDYYFVLATREGRSFVKSNGGAPLNEVIDAWVYLLDFTEDREYTVEEMPLIMSAATLPSVLIKDMAKDIGISDFQMTQIEKRLFQRVLEIRNTLVAKNKQSKPKEDDQNS